MDNLGNEGRGSFLDKAGEIAVEQLGHDDFGSLDSFQFVESFGPIAAVGVREVLLFGVYFDGGACAD